ncbi:hypothetical protein GCK72_014267 [Caenorhabditis remanei]|nr:hypothetical protein GCK72_014267 [Caenorhabditis remanei]KAF1757810.1 hypothetical protein GCK72_014267 [Caenorhabditis remanei]
MAFFISSCGITTLLQYYSPPGIKRILGTLFELSYILLTIFAPYFSLQMSERWQNEFDLIMVKIGIRRPAKVNDVTERSKRLKNTFGDQMDFERNKHSDVYFEQLKKTWSFKKLKN